MYRLTITERQERITEETKCRQRARLVQVRRQASNFSRRTLQRVQAESGRQVAFMKQQLTSEYAAEKENRLAQMESEYSACLRQVGSAHLAAARQPDMSGPRTVLASEQRRVAQQRHLDALERVRCSQRDLAEDRRRCETLRELNHALERVRADRVAHSGHKKQLEECRRSQEGVRRAAAAQASAAASSANVVYQSAFRPRVSFRDDAVQTRPKPRCRATRGQQTTTRGSLAHDPTTSRGSQTQTLGRHKKTGARFPDPEADAAAATAPTPGSAAGTDDTSSRQPASSARGGPMTSSSGRSASHSDPATPSHATLSDVPHSETALTPAELHRELSTTSSRASAAPSGVPLTSETRQAPEQYAVRREDSGYDGRAAARAVEQQQQAADSSAQLQQLDRDRVAAARGRQATRRMSARSEYARLLEELERLEAEERRDRRAGAGSAAQLARATASLASAPSARTLATYEERQRRLNQLFEDALLLASDADASGSSAELVTPARDLAQHFDVRGHQYAEILSAAGGVAEGVQAVNERRSQLARSSLSGPPGTWEPAPPSDAEQSVYSSATGLDQTSRWDESAAAEEQNVFAGEDDQSMFAGQDPSMFGGQDPGMFAGEEELGMYEGEEDPSVYEGEEDPSMFGGQDPSIFAGQDPGMFEGQDPSMFQGQDPNMFQGQDPSMFAGQDPNIFQGQDPSMFQGQDPSMFQGQTPSMLAAQDPSMFQEEDPSLFQEQDPSIFAGQDQLGGEEQGFTDQGSMFGTDAGEQQYYDAEYTGEEGEEPSPEGPPVYTGDDEPDQPLMHVGPDGIYPMQDPDVVAVNAEDTGDVSSLRTADVSSLRTSDVSTPRTSELSALAESPAGGQTFDSENTAYRGVPGEPGDPRLAVTGSHGEVRQYVSQLLDASRQQLSRLSQSSLATGSPSTVYGSASAGSPPSSLSRSQFEGDSTIGNAASKSAFGSDPGDMDTSSAAAAEPDAATSGVYSSDPSQSASTAAAAASESYMKRYSEVMEKLSEVQQRRDELMRSYTSVTDELKEVRSAGELGGVRSSGSRPRPPPSLSRASLADAGAPHELSTIQEGDTTGRTALDGSGPPAAAVAPQQDITSTGSLMSRTAATAGHDDTLSQLSAMTGSQEFASVDSPRPGSGGRSAAGLTAPGSEVSLRSSALERALQASREAIRSISGGGGGSATGVSPAAGSYPALSALSGSTSGAAGGSDSTQSSPDVNNIISKLGMKARSGTLAGADANLSSSSSGSPGERRGTSGDDLRRRVLSKAAAAGGSSSGSSNGSSRSSGSSSGSSIAEAASGVASEDGSGMLAPLDLSTVPGPVSQADSSIDTEKFAAGAVGSTPMKQPPPEGEPVPGLTGAVSMQPQGMEQSPGDDQ